MPTPDKVDLTGAVMVGLDGTELSRADQHRLAHPAVGAICLFTRNYKDVPTLAKLIHQARACVDKPLVVAVDHEGGKVQRFVGRGFSRIEPAWQLGLTYASDPVAARAAACERGTTIARQLKNVNIDLCLGPVLDIDYGRNEMIAERCFGTDAATVTELGKAFCQGLAKHGMPAIGKHFPGHGWAMADSHFEIPVDGREKASLLAADLVPYRELIAASALAGVMISHVHYSKLATGPATYAPAIITELLHGELGFQGKVLSDDLVMEGANAGLNMVERTVQARCSGCDLLLWCGGEPVLLDSYLAHLPATGQGTGPWCELSN